jgi:hypothetical protein
MTRLVRAKRFIAIPLSLCGITLAIASDSPAYVNGEIPFGAIEDVKQQAENWAVCAASYDIMSVIMAPEAPDRAMQLKNLGEGARVALGISLVIKDLEPDISQERFDLLWASSEAAMMEWPQAKLDSILADSEALGTQGAEAFGKKINATVVTCINNLKDQRKHIDTWQELAESGLLKLPGN